MNLTDQQNRRLSLYIDLLLEANKSMNLTRIDTREQAQSGHIDDAMTLLPFLPAARCRVVDVGSGGGIPGIPLAIARDDASFLLVESTKKKAQFLRATVSALGLKNVLVSDDRVEVIAHGDQRECFDVAVARALAPLNILVEWCLPLVKVGGKLLAMKGQKVADELPAAGSAIRQMGGKPAVVHPVPRPGADHHVIVEIVKARTSPSKFPRNASQTKSRPL